MNPQLRAYLFVLAAAALFSTGGAAIKATQLTNWQIAGFRSLVAALAIVLAGLLPVILLARTNLKMGH